MEFLRSRILSVLEHDDLRSHTLVTLSTMLRKLRSDLEQTPLAPSFSTART
jgi:hypothetical protein